VDVFKALNLGYDDFSSLSSDIDLIRPFGDYVGLRETDMDFCIDFDNDLPLDPETPVLGSTGSAPTMDEIEADETNSLDELEDLLPEPGIHNMNDVRKKDRAWLTLSNGKQCHKSSAVEFLLGKDSHIFTTPSYYTCDRRLTHW
jgi:hypothetical protein